MDQGRIVGVALTIAFCSLSFLACLAYLFGLYRSKKFIHSLQMASFATAFSFVNLLNIVALTVFLSNGGGETNYRTVNNIQNFSSALSILSSITIINIDLKILRILVWIPRTGVTEARKWMIRYFVFFIYGLCFLSAFSYDVVFSLNLHDGVPWIFSILSYNLSAIWVILAGVYDLLQAASFSILILKEYVKKKEKLQDETMKAMVAILSVFGLDLVLLGIYLYSSANQSDLTVATASVCVTNAIIPIHPMVLQYLYRAITSIFKSFKNVKEGHIGGLDDVKSRTEADHLSNGGMVMVGSVKGTSKSDQELQTVE